MFILTMKEDDKAAEGAYAVITEHGEKVLQLFQNEDDAVRYMGLLEADDFPDMAIEDIPDEEAIAACRRFGYNYVIITPDDFVIPQNLNHMILFKSVSYKKFPCFW